MNKSHMPVQIRRPRLGYAVFLFQAAVLAGCGGPKGVVADYLNQKKCEDRTKYVLDPDRWGTIIAEHYKSKENCVVKHGHVDTSGCDQTAVGEYCSVKVQDVSNLYCVKRVASSDYKIDWPCSTGWSPVSGVVLLDKESSDPVVVRALLALSTRQDDKYPSDRYFGVRVKVSGNDPVLLAYALRKTPAGEELYKYLQDGASHNATVVIGKPEGRSFEIVRMVQDNWRDMPKDKEQAAQSAAKEYLRLNACCDELNDNLVRCAAGAYCPSISPVLQAEQACRAGLVKAAAGEEKAIVVMRRFKASKEFFPPEKCKVDQ